MNTRDGHGGRIRSHRVLKVLETEYISGGKDLKNNIAKGKNGSQYNYELKMDCPQFTNRWGYKIILVLYCLTLRIHIPKVRNVRLGSQVKQWVLFHEVDESTMHRQCKLNKGVARKITTKRKSTGLNQKLVNYYNGRVCMCQEFEFSCWGIFLYPIIREVSSEIYIQVNLRGKSEWYFRTIILIASWRIN